MDKEHVFSRMIEIKNIVAFTKQSIFKNETTIKEKEKWAKLYELKKMNEISEMKDTSTGKPLYSNFEKRQEAFLKLVEEDPKQEFTEAKFFVEQMRNSTALLYIENEIAMMEFKALEAYSRM